MIENIDINAPDYYKFVMRGAHEALEQTSGIASFSGQEAVDEFRNLVSGNVPSWSLGDGEVKIKFLDERGEVTTDTRIAVAALVMGTAPSANLFFAEQFRQPNNERALPPQTPSLQELASSRVIPQHPIMTDWQAEQIVTNPHTSLDHEGRFIA